MSHKNKNLTHLCLKTQAKRIMTKKKARPSPNASKPYIHTTSLNIKQKLKITTPLVLGTILVRMSSKLKDQTAVHDIGVLKIEDNFHFLFLVFMKKKYIHLALSKNEFSVEN